MKAGLEERGIRFTLDCMLGSLARKLRILGYDAEYDSAVSDRTLLISSAISGRVILTCDRPLFETAVRRGIKCFLVEGETDEERMVSVLGTLGVSSVSIDPCNSRCPICNGLISDISKEDLRGEVLGTVLDKQQVFYRCGSCLKIYWEGSHWKRIMSFAEAVQKKLKDRSVRRGTERIGEE